MRIARHAGYWITTHKTYNRHTVIVWDGRHKAFRAHYGTQAKAMAVGKSVAFELTRLRRELAAEL